MFAALRSTFAKNAQSSNLSPDVDVNINKLSEHSLDKNQFQVNKVSQNPNQKQLELNITQNSPPQLIPTSERKTTYPQLISVVAGYSLCNSQLLIINKVTLAYVPAPCFILFCQLLASGVAVRVLDQLRILDADRLYLEKAKGFLIVVFGFVTTLFANLKSIQLAPVDTFICLRSTTPLILAFLDYFFLGRHLPGKKSFGSLIGISVGVLMYVHIDSNFSVQAYLWIGVWYVVSIFEIIYVKHLVSSTTMTTWGQTYYQNILAVPFLLAMFIALGESQVLENTEWSFGAVFFIVLSCIAGLGMSFLSFLLRDMISATSFSIVGNMCKVATILVNTYIWDQHSSSIGILSLFVCIGSGALYQQAPLRDPTKSYAEREVLPCLSREIYKQIIAQNEEKIFATCVAVLITFCMLLIGIALAFEGEVAVGESNPFGASKSSNGNAV